MIDFFVKIAEAPRTFGLITETEILEITPSETLAHFAQAVIRIEIGFCHHNGVSMTRR
jgi:hypothetical protein